MAEWLDRDRLAEVGLAERYATAAPFPHLVVDDAIPPGRLRPLVEALAEEEADRLVDEIIQARATADHFTTEGMKRLHDELQSQEVRGWVKGLTGEATTLVSFRGYAYGPGDYLLPHADADEDTSRRVAFVLYFDTEGCVGGELELFECQLDGDEIVATIPSQRIAPRPGRLVLFAVGPNTLHQVREVETGRRVSIAGWFRR